nr:MAG TPA: hypothetical protein [Caudoviricetes sp.]
MRGTEKVLKNDSFCTYLEFLTPLKVLPLLYLRTSA